MVFETDWQNIILTPFPPDLSPSSVIDVLHDHSFLITLSPIVTHHNMRERLLQTGWVKYDVFETVELLPWNLWKRRTSFTCCFRDKEDGVTSFVEAQLGVLSEAEYTVRRSKDGEEKREGWVLEEKIESSCNLLLRPVVEGNMMPVRRKLHEHVLEAARKRQGKGNDVDENQLSLEQR